VAGALWVVKSASILLSGYQPPLVFEVPVPLFGVALVALAAIGRHDWRHRVAQALGGVSVVTGCAALASELAGEVWHVALAVAAVAQIVGLVLAGLADRRAPGALGAVGRMALFIGLATIPATAVGGLLELVDERLLEVSTLFLGCLWVWLGFRMLGCHPET
jgi:hypothetical protein